MVGFAFGSTHPTVSMLQQELARVQQAPQNPLISLCRRRGVFQELAAGGTLSIVRETAQNRKKKFVEPFAVIRLRRKNLSDASLGISDLLPQPRMVAERQHLEDRRRAIAFAV